MRMNGEYVSGKTRSLTISRYYPSVEPFLYESCPCYIIVSAPLAILSPVLGKIYGPPFLIEATVCGDTSVVVSGLFKVPVRL
jgi:hypothetical protein